MVAAVSRRTVVSDNFVVHVQVRLNTDLASYIIVPTTKRLNTLTDATVFLPRRLPYDEYTESLYTIRKKL